MRKQKKKKTSEKSKLIKKPTILKKLFGHRFTIGDHYDYPLVLCIGLLMVIGVVMVYSASLYSPNSPSLNLSFLKKQLIFAVGGFFGMIFLSLVTNYRWLNNKMVVIVLGVLGTSLGIIVYLLDRTINGASRWLSIGGFSLQPSEFCKIFIIIIMAYLLTLYSHKLNKLLPSIACLVPVIPMILAVVLNDLSTGLVLAAIAGVMLFTVCAVPFLLAGSVIGFSGLFGAVMLLQAKFRSSGSGGYRIGRFKVWRNPFAYEDLGRQVRYSMYSIATGGLFGKGFGQGMAKLGLSEAYNDTIFAVICEELGMFGAIALIAIYIIMIWRILRIAVNAPDIFGSLFCIGTAVHVSVQVLFHMGVSTNFFPNTGMTLPFVSYGGSSMLALCIELGIVLAISRLIGVKKQEA